MTIFKTQFGNLFHIKGGIPKQHKLTLMAPNGEKLIDGEWCPQGSCAELMLPRAKEDSDYIGYSARMVELEKESYLSVLETTSKVLKPNK